VIHQKVLHGQLPSVPMLTVCLLPLVGFGGDGRICRLPVYHGVGWEVC
jgi:hypothetical protein